MATKIPDDPLHQLGQKIQQERMEKAFHQTEGWALIERLLQKRLSGLLIIGLPKFLWKRSPVSLFSYLAPFWGYLLFVIAFTIGLRTNFPYNLGFYGVATLFFGLISASMIYGFRKSEGFQRIVTGIQMAVVALFMGVAIYRACHVQPWQVPFEPKTVECGLAIIAMCGLFGISVATDLIRAFLNRRGHE
jgi:hypothetical protein